MADDVTRPQRPAAGWVLHASSAVLAIDALLERARRVHAAMAMLRGGMPRREVSAIIFRRFSVDRTTAWRVVEMALDMAGPV